MTKKYEDKLNVLADQNGLVRTSEIEKAGIARYRIRDFVESGFLVRESRGIYSVASEMTDEYAAIQRRSDKLVFSYGTALFFHGLSDRVPSTIDVTVPQGYNVSRIKKDYPNLGFHYVKPELLSFGTETVRSPQGSQIVVYDKERCICDIVKAYSHIDKQLFIQVLREYFRSDFSARKLVKAAQTIGVEEEIRKYMEVL